MATLPCSRDRGSVRLPLYSFPPRWLDLARIKGFIELRSWAVAGPSAAGARGKINLGPLRRLSGSTSPRSCGGRAGAASDLLLLLGPRLTGRLRGQEPAHDVNHAVIGAQPAIGSKLPTCTCAHKTGMVPGSLAKYTHRRRRWAYLPA
jgi:hypothetical protein